MHYHFGFFSLVNENNADLFVTIAVLTFELTSVGLTDLK